MERVFQMVEELKKLDVGEVINQTVAASEKGLVGYNKAQLKKGQDNQGKQLSPPYAKSTQKHKRSGPRPVTLYDTGKFHDSFFIARERDAIEFTATPNEKGRGFSLRDWLKDVYGTSIFGLTDVYFKRLQQICKESVIDKIRAAI